MRYRLGIDLGTNSLGWAAISLKEESGGLEAGPLLDMGVRIFSDARHPKDKSSNAAQRRGPRGMRRNRDRKLSRGRAMMHVLAGVGLMPKTDLERKALEKLDPWVLRADALGRELTPHEIGRALFHLQQRRGFKSNRKTDGDSEGAMFDAIEAVREKMRLHDARTLGELFGRPRRETLKANASAGHGKGRPMPQARVKARMDKSKMAYDYYPDRAMILDEFEKIWAAQKEYHTSVLTDEACEKVRHVIEFQRPLKPQKAGKCTFIEGEPRAHAALPTVQYARVLQDVNNLRVGVVGEVQRMLTEDERKAVVALLMSPKAKTARRTFKAIRKTLNLPESQVFNLESPKRDHLVGDETAGRMMQDDAWGPDWLALNRQTQDKIIIRLLETQEHKDLIAWLKDNHGLEDWHAENVSNIHFTGRQDSHSRLSARAWSMLIPLMESGLRYDEAATQAFRDHRDMGDGKVHEDGLPYYGEILSRHTAFEKDPPASGDDTRTAEEKHGRVANPTVHVALNELRKVVNDLIRRWGPPTQVVLELARDLPLSDRGLRDLDSTQKKNQDANDKRRKQLDCLGEPDTYENRLKLRLFEEAQEAFNGTVQCVFSGKAISIADLFSSNVEIEHILPLSRTWDDSFSNKVLATREANRLKGNRTPHEAFGSERSGTYEWELLTQRAKALPKSKSWRFAPDAMEKWEERGGDFLARQLNDTRYISRLGKEFVEALYGGQGSKGQARQVWVVPGRLTSDLRHYAGFNSLSGFTDTNQKDRTDHRHHAVDALVVALTDQAMLQRSAKLAKREDQVAHYEIMQAMAEPLKRYRKSAEDRLKKLVVSHKPDHGFQDAMHNDTAYGITGDLDDKKQSILVTRKPLDALDQKDIVEIVDPKLRGHFAYVTEGLSGAAFKEAIVAAGKALFPPVYSVRLTTPMKPTSFVTVSHGKNGEHTKAYKGDGNYCYDIFMGPKGKWDGEVITTFQAYQRAQADPEWWRKLEREDGSPLIMRIRKGDMLEIDDGSGERRVFQVAYITKGTTALAEHFQSDVDRRTRKSYKGPAPLKYTFKAPSSLQASEALRVTVSPSGKVRRHKA